MAVESVDITVFRDGATIAEVKANCERRVAELSASLAAQGYKPEECVFKEDRGSGLDRPSGTATQTWVKTWG